MTSNASARKTFDLERTPKVSKFASYRVRCLVESCSRPQLGLWDMHQNALNKGYAHAHLAHEISSDRGIHVSSYRMFKEPE